MAGDQVIRLNYLQWQAIYAEEKPYQVFSNISEKDSAIQQTTNLVFQPGELETIHDARGIEETFDLDTEGFKFATHQTRVCNFKDRRLVEGEYFQEMEQLLRKHVQDVDQVYFFDWRIRRNEELKGQSVIDANDKTQRLLPAVHVHIDQAPSAVVGRILLHLPEQAEQLLKRRVRVINIWRPLNDIILDRPLAICDSRSILDRDLVEADHVRKHYNGSNYYALPSKHYKWWYLSGQQRHEVTMFKNFDSDSEVPGRRCLHTSFKHLTRPDDCTPRESIEVRALVFSRPT